MKELLLYIAKSLVQHPDQVTVTECRNGDELTLELRVAPEDMGRVIWPSGAACDLQQADGGGAAAAGEELLVVCHGALAVLEDAVRDRHGSGEAGGILEDVVIVEEMGDPGPLQGDLVIGHHIRAEVQSLLSSWYFLHRASAVRAWPFSAILPMASSNSANMVWRYTVPLNWSMKWLMR